MDFHATCVAALGALAATATAQETRTTTTPPQSEFDRALDEALARRDATQPAGTLALPGGAQFRLLDLSLDALVNAGGSSERDEGIGQLQLGGHDPSQRGFTVSNVELSGIGAVDPYFQFESHLIYFIDPEGESQFELEEVFARTSSLPAGLQLKIGQYFTEFGRINSQHPHAWDFIDQPVIHGRVFGPDGMRGPGARLAWLAPVPWFAELTFGMHNSGGETMASFRSTDEEEAPGGHLIEERDVRSLEDFVFNARLNQSFDLGRETVSQFGLSGAWGPSGAGTSTRSALYGADLRLKWTPAVNDAGWPFVVVQGEAIQRVYGTTLQEIDDPDTIPGSGDEVFLAGDTLEDRGFYAYVLWGFRRDWVAGLRWETASASGDGLVLRDDDPLRDDRQRFSPMLAWHPTHFSRVRLQYNLDVADHLEHDRAHSVWLGLEFLVGNHPAHTY